MIKLSKKDGFHWEGLYNHGLSDIVSEDGSRTATFEKLINSNFDELRPTFNKILEEIVAKTKK